LRSPHAAQYLRPRPLAEHPPRAARRGRLRAVAAEHYTRRMREPNHTPHISVAEYLRSEARSPVRHEYVRGEVYAMPGGTFRHNLIAGNIFVRLKAAARGGPCHVYINDVEVQPGNEVFYYPDVVAVCERQDLSDVVATSPCLIAEVTSRSSARVDRGEKLLEYRQAPALRAYLIVDQNRKRV